MRKTAGKMQDGGRRANPGARRRRRDMRVLADRNPAVVPVGAWVEIAEEEQENAGVRAIVTEELLEETRRMKEEDLIRFQDAVRRRVSEQARIQKRHRLQKLETAKWEHGVVNKSPDSAPTFTQQRELANCHPGAHWVEAHDLQPAGVNQYRHQQQQQSKIMKQVRHRLASCRTVHEGDDASELPGGIWKVSPARDKVVRRMTDDDDEEEEEASTEGQDQPQICSRNSKTVTFQNDMVSQRDDSRREPTSLYYRSTRVLWPSEDAEEEQKLQRRSQLTMYRRRFMDLEREQAKEHQRLKNHLRRIARIKAEKEQQREEEEKRMELVRQQEESRRELAERENLILERLRLEEEAHEEERRRARAKKSKETTRYVEALRAQIKEKLEQEKIELPPLCCCGGESFWDSHPDTCANNCTFYNNPKGYVQALHSVLLSCGLNEGDAGHGGFIQKLLQTLAHQS